MTSIVSRLPKALLVLASVVYLIVEVVFNMSLLEAVSSARLTALHDIEEFGRIASASGFTLAMLGLFLSKTGFRVHGIGKWILFAMVLGVCAFPFVATPYGRLTLLSVGLGAAMVVAAALSADRRRLASAILSVAGIVVMAWPAFYQGKPAVVDHYIVDPSSGEDRLAAGYITLLRRALIADVVQLEDLALEDFGGADSPEAKAFLVMLGPLAVNAESLLAWAERPANVEGLVRSLLNSRRVVDVEQEYARYERHRAEFLDSYYGPYETASRRYIERGAEMARQAEAAWLEIQQELDSGWATYQTAQSDFVDGYVDLVRRQRVVDRFLSFVERRNRCRSATQCGRLERDYEATMRQITDPPPDWRYFCDEAEPPKRNRGLQSLTRILRGGDLGEIARDVHRIATEDDQKVLVCNPSEATFGQRLAAHDSGKFAALPDNRAGLPMGLDHPAYLAHPNLAALIRRDLESRHDVTLGQDWSVTDHETFYRAFRAAGEAAASRQLEHALGALDGELVEVGLDVHAFERLPFVQEKLRELVGDDYAPGFSLMLSERQFAERIVRPRVEAAIRAELAAFREGSARYEDGGAMAELGKDQLRLVLVPPIAVALSLLFSFVSLAKVSTSLLTPAFTGSLKGWRRGVAGFLFWAAPIVAMVALPFLVTNSYAESRAWKLLSMQAAAQSPATAVMSEYVMRVQPIFALVGYPVLRVFDPYGLRPETEDDLRQPDSATSHRRPGENAPAGAAEPGVELTFEKQRPRVSGVETRAMTISSRGG